MHKKKLFFIIILFVLLVALILILYTFIFSKTSSSSNFEGIKTGKEHVHNKIIQHNGDEGWFDDSYGVEEIRNNQGEQFLSDYPFFYKNNFNSSIQDYNCILASIYSYSKGKVIPPDELQKKISKTEQSSVNKQANIVAKLSNMNLKIGKISIKRIDEVLNKNGSVMIHIKNKSIFGKQGAFILIKQLINNGTCVAFIPNSTIEDTCLIDANEDGKTIYSLASIFVAAGENSDCYYFTRKG